MLVFAFEDGDFTIPYTYTQRHELVHNNFGWGNGTVEGAQTSSNGWYYRGIFDANNGHDYSSGTFKSGENGNYKYKNEMLINIR